MEWLTVKGQGFGSEVKATHHQASREGEVWVTIRGAHAVVSLTPHNLRELAANLVKVAESVEREDALFKAEF